jgi:hypothetical protein
LNQVHHPVCKIGGEAPRLEHRALRLISSNWPHGAGLNLSKRYYFFNYLFRLNGLVRPVLGPSVKGPEPITQPEKELLLFCSRAETTTTVLAFDVVSCLFPEKKFRPSVSECFGPETEPPKLFQGRKIESYFFPLSLSHSLSFSFYLSLSVSLSLSLILWYAHVDLGESAHFTVRSTYETYTHSLSHSLSFSHSHSLSLFHSLTLSLSGFLSLCQ